MGESEPLSMEFDAITRLDENYLFLLQFVEKPLSEMSPEMQTLAKKWLFKLGTEADMRCSTDKLIRNNYLSELIHCLQEKNLGPLFNAPPPQGELKWVKFNNSWLVDKRDQPKWLENLMKDEANKVHVGGKNFETYLSTKLFDNGRGACSYIAISAQNEGDETAWVKIRPNKRREDIIEQMFEKEMKKFSNEDK